MYLSTRLVGVRTLLTKKTICLWCGFERDLHPTTEHCDKMIQRALSRPRKNGDGCNRSYCGHSKKEHKGKQYTVLDDDTKILERNTLCSHPKSTEDEFCECEAYL